MKRIGQAEEDIKAGQVVSCDLDTGMVRLWTRTIDPYPPEPPEHVWAETWALVKGTLLTALALGLGAWVVMAILHYTLPA